MPLISVNSNAGIISPIQARAAITVRITVLGPNEAAKTITSYAFRATARISPGGRIIKTWHTSTGGGIAIISATTGMIEMSFSQAQLPPMPHATLELVEYSLGSLTGPPTDRFRFSMPVSGGEGVSY